MIIPDLGKASVMGAIKSVIGRADDSNLKRRMKFVDFYEGEHDQYIEKHFQSGPQLPPYTANITKRMVNARSLVYKDSPIRLNDKYNEILPLDVDSKCRQMEKLTFLLGTMSFKSSWGDDGLEYELVPYFWPMFLQGETEPCAIFYPIANMGDKSERLYEFWSDEEHFRFNEMGQIMNLEDEGMNMYGKMPITFAHRSPEIVDEFFQAGASDIVSANEHIDILFKTLMIAARIDSLGIKYASGVRDDTPIRAGVDEVILLPDGVTLGRLEGGNPEKIINVIKTVIQSTALNNHLVARFVDSEARSGVALKVENLENFEERKASVSDIWLPFENKRFQIDRMIASANGVQLSDDYHVDFAEPENVLSPDEQRAEWDWLLSKGLISKRDILKQMNPDLDDAEADRILGEVKEETTEPQQGLGLSELLAS
jgi:hypothetical protein